MGRSVGRRGEESWRGRWEYEKVKVKVEVRVKEVRSGGLFVD